MQKLIQKVIRVYSSIIQDIVVAEDQNEITEKELQLYSFLVGPMILFAGLLNIPLGIIWGISSYHILIYFIASQVSGWLILILQGKKISRRIKTISIEILVFACVLITYFIYYPKITVMFWFILMILTILSTVSSNRNASLYMFSIYICMYILVAVQYKLNVAVYAEQNMPFHGVLFVFILLINLVNFVVNYIYILISKRNKEQYLEIKNKNHHITLLYEQIKKREKILEEKNEVLSQYSNQLEKNKKKLEDLVYKDSLTGLPNRRMILEKLEQLITNNSSAEQFAFITIDIDDFRKVNDSMGHTFGDYILLQTIDRIESIRKKEDILARSGGDDLLLLVQSTNDHKTLETYIKTICDVFESSFHIASIQMKITVSMGVSLWPQDGDSAENILKASETAMHKSKSSGKNTYYFYHKDMQEEIIKKIQMEQYFIQAFENESFYLEYQPLFDTKTKEIRSYEALIRLEIPKVGKISPAEFIPYAEESGMIHALGEWVIRTVCAKINECQRLYHTKIKVAINVSPLQIYATSFVENAKRLLELYDIDPSCIEFEITESIFIHQKEKAIHIIKQLRAYGISIAMDDFGTGFSSLSYLINLPIDKLKIDKSFIDTISCETKDQKNSKNIVGSIIDMAHHLNLLVVAEGIESKEQEVYLEENNCDLLQGFLLSKPLKETQINELLQEKKKDKIK